MPNNMHENINILEGANIDIDLATQEGDISWKQDKCPWNEVEKNNEHKCALKNVSICEFFCGVNYLDKVLCCYPNENPLKGQK